MTRRHLIPGPHSDMLMSGTAYSPGALAQAVDCPRPQTLLEGLPVTTFAVKKGRILLGKEGSGRERIGVV